MPKAFSRTQFWVLVFCIGVFAGVIGVAFNFVVSTLVDWFWLGEGTEAFAVAVQESASWYRILIPALGGLCVGLLLHWTQAPEVAGEGVPAVRRALVENGSNIRYRVAPLKFLATALTISTGGSAGREGPVIQIGAAIGSGIARIRSVSEQERRVLLCAGAAATMGATFGTPAAALIFVVEVLRQKILVRDGMAVVLATALGTVVARGVFGYEGVVFTVPPWVPTWSTDGLLLFVTAAMAAVLACVFTVTLSKLRSFFIRLPLPVYLLPAVGGLIVGILALYSPLLYEPAMYTLITDLLAGNGPVGIFVLGLLVVKIIATSVTIGSGGSGGIFAPSLFLGALLGSVVMYGASFFGVTLSPLYIAFGMMALFAAAAHAPLTAAFMLIEMTDSFVLLPICILLAYGAYGLARLITRKNLYDIDT